MLNWNEVGRKLPSKNLCNNHGKERKHVNVVATIYYIIATSQTQHLQTQISILRKYKTYYLRPSTSLFCTGNLLKKAPCT